MSYKRSIHPKNFFTGAELDSAFAAIGTAQGSTLNSINPNIEDTLLSGSIEAVNKKNGRIAGLLVDWISTHHEFINVERLTIVVRSLNPHEFRWVKIFWCANAQRLEEDDPRWKKLAQLFERSNRFDFIDRNKKENSEGSTEYLIERNGEDPRFQTTCIRVPNKTFQHRPESVFSADRIARIHKGFRERLIIGPTYRADMWAALKLNSTLTPSELAQKTYGSYATAHKVKKHYLLIKRDNPKRGKVA